MFPTQSQFVRIRISEVNMDQHVVTGIDAYGKSYRVMQDFHGSVVMVPQLGEIWQAQRRGNEWILYQRLEPRDKTTPIETLVAGDRRLEADNKLYLNGKYVLINGTDFQSILDRLTALETLVASL